MTTTNYGTEAPEAPQTNDVPRKRTTILPPAHRDCKEIEEETSLSPAIRDYKDIEEETSLPPANRDYIETEDETSLQHAEPSGQSAAENILTNRRYCMSKKS